MTHAGERAARHVLLALANAWMEMQPNETFAQRGRAVAGGASVADCGCAAVGGGPVVVPADSRGAGLRLVRSTPAGCELSRRLHRSSRHELTIAAKLCGSRLAPPTRAPSTSGRADRSAALAGLTLPPYSRRQRSAAAWRPVRRGAGGRARGPPAPARAWPCGRCRWPRPARRRRRSTRWRRRSARPARRQSGGRAPPPSRRPRARRGSRRCRRSGSGRPRAPPASCG